MENWSGRFLDICNAAVKNSSYKGIKICTVKTVKPFVFTYDGIEIGAKEEDTVYVHPLFISDAIELDLDSMKDSQSFNSSTAYNSPQFTAIIEGTVPQFILDFYNFYKNWQAAFLLNAGDLIAVLELKGNAYLVLQKINLDIYKEENKGEDEDGI